MRLSRNLDCQYDPERGRTTIAIGEIGGIGGAQGNTTLKGLKNTPQVIRQLQFDPFGVWVMALTIIPALLTGLLL